METLTINKDFAAKYKKKKEAEELSKLRDLHGDVGVASSDSSSSESEDEEGVWSPQTETDFLRTLSLLKKKDPQIYDKDVSFYFAGEHQKVSLGHNQTKAVYLKDYDRERLLDRGSKAELSDSEISSEDRDDVIVRGDPPQCGHTYQEEQDELKEGFKRALSEADEDKQILTLRVKTIKEKAVEEKEYLEWLNKNEGNRDLDTLKSFWADPHLEKEEEFLRDYILGQGHRDNADITVPTYEEVVGGQEDVEGGSDSEDEEALEEQEEFERKFNFRFEEPEGDLIKAYPRTVANSVRIVDDSRKQKRLQKQERIKQEKEREQEELKRLKNLKRNEFQERLKEVSKITGNSVESLGSLTHELDEDFDPQSYDQSMEALFGTEYYEGEEESKPEVTWEDQDWDPSAVDWNEPLCDDSDFNMDADFDPTNENEQMISRAKRKKTFSSQRKPNFDPNESSFDEYVNEHYKLDPLVREGGFKYRNVASNDFGLSAEEILSCDNRELNSWVSLSRMVQYRTEEEEKRDHRVYRKRGRDWKRKKRCLTSIYTGEQEDEDEPSDSTHSKKRTKVKGHGVKTLGDSSRSSLKKRKRKVKTSSTQLSETRLKSYGI